MELAADDHTAHFPVRSTSACQKTPGISSAENSPFRFGQTSNADVYSDVHNRRATSRCNAVSSYGIYAYTRGVAAARIR